MIAQALEHHSGGKPAAAEALCREALALDRQHAQAWGLLAAISLDRNDLACALECYEQILSFSPDDAEHLVNAAEVSRRTGRLGRALELSQRALATRQSDSRAWRVRGKALEELGRTQEAQRCLRRGHELKPDNADIHSDLLFLLSATDYLPPEQLAGEYRRWGERHADPLTAASAAHTNLPDPDRALRIGYVSADFRSHPVARFTEPFLDRHDRRCWRVYCYSSCARPDAVSARLRGRADVWRDISSASDETAERLIREDCIDILVDLSGHTRGNRLSLFARRPAPVQITWFGFLGGSGMAAMDYRITDFHIDPVGVSDRCYRERLLRLPRAIACYQPQDEAPAVNDLPALTRGHITFGSFNSFSKLSAETIRTWAELLRRLPRARLRVLGAPPGEGSDHVIEMFESEGIAAGRIDMLGRLQYQAYLEQYLQVDVALDAYPYNGGMTTADSLWMGVPVISRAGRSALSRFGASHLTNIGLASWIAASSADYIGIALRVAADLPALARLRAGLRDRMRTSPLADAGQFTADLEALYRDAWRAWCAQAPQRSGGC
ncbi:MAG TPA: tetratricopeptide repeat protein [Burkholderiales bacterium]